MKTISRMMAIGGMLLVWAMTAASMALAADETAPEPVRPTVKVVLNDGHGSGFYIGGNLIVTAAHVTKDARAISVEFGNGDKRIGTRVFEDRINDLAIVRVTAAPKGAVALSPLCGPVPVGALVEARGFPLGFDFSITRGYVVGGLQRVGSKWRSAFVVDITAAPGMSGGPVIHEGKVVGIVVGGAAGFVVIVPSISVCRVLTLIGHDV